MQILLYWIVWLIDADLEFGPGPSGGEKERMLNKK